VECDSNIVPSRALQACWPAWALSLLWQHCCQFIGLISVAAQHRAYSSTQRASSPKMESGLSVISLRRFFQRYSYIYNSAGWNRPFTPLQSSFTGNFCFPLEPQCPSIVSGNIYSFPLHLDVR